MDNLYETGYYDSLTNLPNLAQFRNLAGKLLDSRQMRSQGIAFVYFNVENFKSFNRRYGIEAGDGLLRTISQLLQSTFQGRVIARLDVDHFAVIAEWDGLEKKIEELWEDVHSFRKATRVELKAGIYLVDDDVKDASVALDRAMMACNSIRDQYDAKFGYFDPETEEQLQRENAIIDHFLSDMEDHHIELAFQPIVRTLTGQVCAFEALSRWKSPELGVLSPGEFVPVLEKHGVVHKLDLYVVEQVCRKLREEMEHGRNVVPVSINFSGVDFKSQGIVSAVEKIVAEYEIPRELIYIEIASNTFGDAFSFIKEAVKEFRRLGYEVWMDDFGMGYSSLDSLKDYNFDAIKINMKYLADCSTDGRSGAILLTIIDMAKRLNLRTVAEGVETKDVFEFLKQGGCELMQGFFFGKPERLDEKSFLALNVERPEERSYQNHIGQINLYGTGLLAHNLDKNRVMPGGLPMAVLEVQNGEIHYLRINDAFAGFLKQTGDGTTEQSEAFLNQKDRWLSSVFFNTMQKCRLSGRSESLDFVRNGQYCNMRVRMIDSNEYKAAFLIICLNLSEFTHPEAAGKLEQSLRYLYSVYNRVDLFAEDGSEIETVYRNPGSGNEGFEAGDFDKAIRSYAARKIYGLDSLRFVQFYDVKTLHDRIAGSGCDYVTDYFRTKTESGDYVWQEYRIVRSEFNGRSMYLSCISNVDVSHVLRISGEEMTSGS